MFRSAKCFESDGRAAFLFFGLLLAGLAFLPNSTTAQCASWDANGKWSFWQGSPQKAQLHSITSITLQQKGTLITGTASAGASNADGKYFEKSGIVDGSLESDRFSIQIFWNTSEIGIYNAKVLPSGRLQGDAHEKRSPHISYPWNSTGVLKCIPPPPPAPKPLRSSGKAKPAPAPPTPTPPFISASQAIIPTPYHPFGIVHLGWDGGPDHPAVAVWVSINNGAEIPAFSIQHAAQSPVWKLPKIASIELQLQRKHHYKFVLKGAGKTLSTAAFVVP